MNTDVPALLVFATENDHKVREIKQILGETGAEIALDGLVSMRAFNLPSPVEDGVTFAQNAAIKARHVALATGLPAFADDSGLVVDVLGGAPGVFSARWGGKHGDDVLNRRLLLDQLADVPEQYRRAAFVCAVCVAVPQDMAESLPKAFRAEAAKQTGATGSAASAAIGQASPAPAGLLEFFFEGKMVGTLLSEERGQGGFGYDPIFLPDGFTQSTAQMSAAEKNAISHRGKAIRLAAPLLGSILACS